MHISLKALIISKVLNQYNQILGFLYIFSSKNKQYKLLIYKSLSIWFKLISAKKDWLQNEDCIAQINQKFKVLYFIPKATNQQFSNFAKKHQNLINFFTLLIPTALIFIISMNISQKSQKKDFSLSQYYSQLSKFENSLPSSKFAPLKKDASLSSLTRQKSKPSQLQKTYKEQFFQDKSKLQIFNKYANKSSQQKFDVSRLENLKKTFGNSQKINKYQESLTTSNVTHKLWLKDSEKNQKQNIDFSKKEEENFVTHCSELYRLAPGRDIVNQIAKQINKRDEVYQLVSEQFGSQQHQNYGSKLEKYFEEYELMKKIIQQFKSISKLDITDLSQLYYFLKSEN